MNRDYYSTPERIRAGVDIIMGAAENSIDLQRTIGCNEEFIQQVQASKNTLNNAGISDSNLITIGMKSHYSLTSFLVNSEKILTLLDRGADKDDIIRFARDEPSSFIRTLSDRAGEIPTMATSPFNRVLELMENGLSYKNIADLGIYYSTTPELNHPHRRDAPGTLFFEVMANTNHPWIEQNRVLSNSQDTEIYTTQPNSRNPSPMGSNATTRTNSPVNFADRLLGNSDSHTR
jgi:hypothetical protein